MPTGSVCIWLLDNGEYCRVRPLARDPPDVCIRILVFLFREFHQSRRRIRLVTRHHATPTRAESTIPSDAFLWQALVHVLDVKEQFCFRRLTHCRVRNWSFSALHIIFWKSPPLSSFNSMSRGWTQVDRLNWWLLGRAEYSAQVQTVSRSQNWLSSQPFQLQRQDIGSALNDVQFSFASMGLPRLLAPTVHSMFWCASASSYVHPDKSAQHNEYNAVCPHRCNKAFVRNMNLGANRQRFICFLQGCVTFAWRYIHFLGQNTLWCKRLSRYFVQVLDGGLHWQFLHGPCPCNDPIGISCNQMFSRDHLCQAKHMQNHLSTLPPTRSMAWQQNGNTPLQAVLRALVRCAPVLARQVLVDDIGHALSRKKKKETLCCAEIFSPILVSNENV